MPKNVMKMLKPSPTLGRNDFDLSNRIVNTINFGELMPFLNIPTVPGSKYQIKTADLIRAIPMVTSPFMRAKQHIDIWFVPYNLLWSRFNEFMVDKDEKLSSALKDRAFVPHVHLKELLDQIEAQVGTTDIVGQDFRKGAYRLLDALGYPSFKYFFGNGMTEDEEDKAVNLWPLLAYNYIWYTEYRQQYYDDGNWLFGGADYIPYCCNADFLPCTSADLADFIRYDGSGFSGLVYGMCQMRYRTWKKDLFTGLLPSTQFGSVSTLPTADSILIQNQVYGLNFDSEDSPTYALTSSDFGRWRNSNSSGVLASTLSEGNISTNPTFNQLTINGVANVAHNHEIDVERQIGVSSRALTTGALDILSLRKAEAVQIWRENALRAGNYLEDNFEAHYGVRPKSHMNRHPVHIGSIDAPLNIGDIDSHAQTGDGANQQLADVAGKGISSLGRGSFNFQTNEFGVILGIVSMLPETEYMSTGINREHQLLEREDYFVPEYSRLGLQPVDTSTFYFGGTRSINSGYAPRDFGYKQQLDKVHLDFFNTTDEIGVFRSWVSPKYDVYDALKEIMENSGINSMPLNCLYVNPALFDVNFAVGVENSRQFLVNYFFDVDGIQPMPVSGMPSY